jgi:sialate O-acetylesterase
MKSKQIVLIVVISLINIFIIIGLVFLFRDEVEYVFTHYLSSITFPNISKEIPNDVKLQLPAIYRDNMVLQRNQTIKIQGLDDAGTKLSVQMGSKNEDIVVGTDGKWSLELGEFDSGGPYNLVVKSQKEELTIKDIYIGDVWICSGQSNMYLEMSKMPAPVRTEAFKVTDAVIRIWQAEQKSSFTPLSIYDDISQDKLGWQIPTNELINKFSALCYLSGKKIADETNVPIGLVQIAMGSSTIESWISSETLNSYPKAKELLDANSMYGEYSKIPKDMQGCSVQTTVTVNNNSFVMPISSLNIKGVILYQGESNARRGYEYRELFPLLVKDWRNIWNKSESELPFYFVQLPKYNLYPEVQGENAWIELRDSQSYSELHVANTYMVPATDTGTAENIHSADKDIIAKRMAQKILSKQYGIGKFMTNSYLYSATIEGDYINVVIDGLNGKLTAKNVSGVQGFQIAGKDMKFVEAKAEIISNNTVKVTSKLISQPKYVRFDWYDVSFGDLKDDVSGLPIVPFRTDAQEFYTFTKDLEQRPLCK